MSRNATAAIDETSARRAAAGSDWSEWIDRIAAPYAAGDYAAEAARARTEYVELTGRSLGETGDDVSLERGLRSFLEWYVLERPLLGGDTPIVRYAREQAVRESDRPVLQRLATTHRSLFELIAMRSESVLLRDAVLGGTWQVRERREPSMPGAAVGDLFEGRLVALDEGMAFLGNLAFFPRAARNEILVLCDNAQDTLVPSAIPSANRFELLWDLTRRRARSERYKHLRPNRFYEPS